MASWNEIKEWSAAEIGTAADVMVKARKDLVGLQEEIDASATPREWEGDAVDSAKAALRKRKQELEIMAAETAALASALDGAEQAVRSLHRTVEELDTVAAKHQFRIDNGEVVDTADGDSEEFWLSRMATRTELVSGVAGVLTAAEEIDDDLTRTIQRVVDGELDDGGATTLADAADAGEQRVELDEFDDQIREKYQVSPDPDGMTEWPDGVTGWAWEQLGNDKNQVTATEAEILDELQLHEGILGVKELADIRQDALHRGETVFDGEGITDGHSDAFRHAYWNARMAQRFGDEWAAEFATAHERNPESHATPVAMDLHNNEVGRRIAAENPDASPEELVGLIEQAVRDGEMVVIDNEGTVAPSDQVQHGDTYDTRDNPWPTNNEDRNDHTTPDEPSTYPDDRY
ncbi:DUF6973 domain-containing protein [Haloechinothrix halophila]|uniref:DUF6973 domain-containing protein n=1 Tax=Haloechinothrix halophila TaxID=1069073 RepID=UPI00040EE357|nr:hypothetical protein [Haloechinothrix halophila]